MRQYKEDKKDKKDKEEIITPITLRIQRKLWEQFKDKTPRSKKLNDAVVELIEKAVNL